MGNVLQKGFLIAFATLMMTSCSLQEEKKIVIYTSVDQVFSEPLLLDFQQKTGIQVLPVYDIEASKSTGLAQRILAEKDKPQGDVFWSGEFGQTMMLHSAKVLTPYTSPSASDIPDAYKDAEGYWTGFGGRARVLLINTDLVNPADYPKSLYDLLDPKYPGDKIGMAYPLFGTTSNHVAALYAALGRDQALDYLKALKGRGITVVSGNSVVRDMVAEGQLWMGLTDTDDALSARQNDKPVELVFLDQEAGGLGTLVMPNTVAMLKNGPHPKEAKVFIDYLLSIEAESMLYESGWFDLTVRPIDGLSPRIDSGELRHMSVDYQAIFKELDTASKDMQEVFVK